MKLYAKVESDRASKGQGGNEYICIKLTVQNGSKKDYPIGEIILEYKDDVETHQINQNEWVLKYLPFNSFDAEIIDQGNIEPPENKQRLGGAKLKCFWCNNKAEVKDYREIDGTTGSYPVCRKCFNLPIEELLRRENKQKGKKKKGECSIHENCDGSCGDWGHN